ncbi:MAG: hypothetical protein RL040_787, partial [Bacteroidota bacterium]
WFRRCSSLLLVLRESNERKEKAKNYVYDFDHAVLAQNNLTTNHERCCLR